MIARTKFESPIGKHSLTVSANLKDLIGNALISGLQAGMPGLRDPKYMKYLLKNNLNLLADLSIDEVANIGAQYDHRGGSVYGKLGQHMVSYQPESDRIEYSGGFGKYNVGAYRSGSGSKDWGVNVSFPVDI